MKTCNYYKKYKALRAPKCGCEGCQTKWNKKKLTT